jgi:hypothetical protein
MATGILKIQHCFAVVATAPKKVFNSEVLYNINNTLVPGLEHQSLLALNDC